MKTTRLVITGILAVLVIGLVVHLVSEFRYRSQWNRTVAALQGLSREQLDTAVQSFVRDQKTGHKTVPATVSLRELAAGGYLRADEVAAFNGTETTVALTTVETNPTMVFIWVRFPNGPQIVELNDGSIQLSPK